MAIPSIPSYDAAGAKQIFEDINKIKNEDPKVIDLLLGSLGQSERKTLMKVLKLVENNETYIYNDIKLKQFTSLTKALYREQFLTPQSKSIFDIFKRQIHKSDVLNKLDAVNLKLSKRSQGASEFEQGIYMLKEGNRTQALQQFQAAEKNGNANACYYLFRFKETTNPKEAQKLLEEGADKGDFNCQVALGLQLLGKEDKKEKSKGRDLLNEAYLQTVYQATPRTYGQLISRVGLDPDLMNRLATYKDVDITYFSNMKLAADKFKKLI